MKKKILIIIGEYWSTFPLFRWLQNNYEVNVISFYNSRNVDEDENVREISLNAESILKKSFKRFKTINFEIKNFKPDYVFSFHDDASFFTLPFLFLKRKPFYISGMRAGIGKYQAKSFKQKIENCIIKLFFNRFDLILTPSKITKIDIQNYFGFKNVDFEYNPILLEGYLKKANEKISRLDFLNKKDFVFLTIGRLTSSKNYFDLIKAFEGVVKKYSNAKLLIIGNGELELEIKSLISNLNLDKNIFLLGTKINVFPYIKLSNFFVLNSDYESYGNVLMEALSQNKLVISTDCGGPREILAPNLSIYEKIKYPYYSEYGILIKNKNNFKMLRDLMIKVIENKDLQNKYKKGLKRAKDFDILSLEKEYQKIFK